MLEFHQYIVTFYRLIFEMKYNRKNGDIEY